jgi:DNA processing protein
MNKDLFNILKIIRGNNIGPAKFYQFIKFNNNLEELIELIPSLAKRLNHNITLASDDEINAEIEKTQQFGAQILCYKDESYPSLLKTIPNSPPVIVVKGNINLINKPQLAIIGSRAASYNNLMLTEKWARALSKNYVITSGLARGVDKHAHLGALKNGTIAVIAGGVDVIYPLENKKLYEDILDNQGAIVSEMAINYQPLAKNFPRRNRIISGLSSGVVVMEAGLKSGSLITARYALDFNRECFAVPGSPINPKARGSNSLIKNNQAHLVESAEEILELLHQPKLTILEENNIEYIDCEINDESKIPDVKTTTDLKNQLLSLLDYEPTDVSMLQENHNFDLPSLHLALLELEIDKKIIRLENSYIAKLKYS